MKTKIATLMAVYGGDDPNALALAIDSILGQKFTGEVESRIYLAVDGPVSKEIERTIAEREEKIFLIYRLPANKGLAAALNAVIKELREEEYIFRMDADDFSHSFRYQTQLDYLKRNPSVDILGTDIIEVDVESGSRRRIAFSRGHDEALSRLSRGVPVAHPTVCFRRRVLDYVGGYPLSGTNEDIALWFKCAKAGFRFDNVREALLDFTVSSNFWRRRSLAKAFSEFRCYFAGIWALEGMTWKYIFPLLRFALRVSPRWLSRMAYQSSIRRIARVEV